MFLAIMSCEHVNMQTCVVAHNVSMVPTSVIAYIIALTKNMKMNGSKHSLRQIELHLLSPRENPCGHQKDGRCKGFTQGNPHYKPHLIPQISPLNTLLKLRRMASHIMSSDIKINPLQLLQVCSASSGERNWVCPFQIT